MIDNKDKIELAARLLGIDINQAEQNLSFLTEDSAIYVSIPEKGGASIIVGDDGNVLYADSSVGFSRHIDEYRKGTRTPLDAFSQNGNEGQ